MKKLLLLITALFLLTACSGNNQVGMVSGSEKKPRIPSPSPRIPEGRQLQASVLSTSSASPKVEVDMEQLVEKINKNLKRTAVTKEEVQQGWYYGKKEERKLGTPSSWLWIEDGSKSRWVSPHTIEAVDVEAIEELCNSTGGNYVASCLDYEDEDCQFVSKSECRCGFNTKWVDRQGCVLTNEEGSFIQITPDELRQGWYEGQKSQKKLNTPLSWVWMESRKQPRWQNPPAQ